jgi:hypothetical protein
MVPNLKKLSNLFTDIFLDSHDTPPKEITLDIDATDIKAHGHQENSFFHGDYEERCFLPLYIFCGHHLLLAQRRPSNIDSARVINSVRRVKISMPNAYPYKELFFKVHAALVPT